MTFDSRAVDHVIKFPRPSPPIFTYCKRSKTGGVEGPGNEATCLCVSLRVWN